MRLEADPGETFALAHDASEGWRARLSLELDARAGHTVLRRNAHEGPLRVQRPFHPEGPTGACHVYLLHPPGGVVGSDRLQLDARLREGAHALLTTPGAGKFYRSGGARAWFGQRARVERGARLELLPQETLAFRGAEADLFTRVDLDAGASALGWEILCLGRPAAGERFDAGHVRQRLELWRGGRLSFRERASYGGGDAVQRAPWGLAGHATVGLFWCTPADASLRDAVREACEGSDAYCAFTCVRSVLVGRGLAGYAAPLRAVFERAWKAVRRARDGREPARPRVWDT